MNRLLMVVIMALSVVTVNTVRAEEPCYDAIFAVSETPIDATPWIDPCRRIIPPPDTVMSIKEEDTWAPTRVTVVLAAGTMPAEGMQFRTGAQPARYEVRPMGKKSEFALKNREIRLQIVDVPQHLKGGENALWYEIGKTLQGINVIFLKEYATQILVPAGYDIRIMADVGIKVKYAGKETAYEPEQQVLIAGIPGKDLVTIYGVDRDGKAAISASPRKGEKQGNQKKTDGQRKQKK